MVRIPTVFGAQPSIHTNPESVIVKGKMSLIDGPLQLLKRFFMRRVRVRVYIRRIQGYDDNTFDMYFFSIKVVFQSRWQRRQRCLHSVFINFDTCIVS